MFEYKAIVIKVVDGDTVDVQVDLGFDTFRNVKLRLKGINTPETRTKDTEEKTAGMAAKARLAQLIYGLEVVVKTYKDRSEKYGRYLADIFLDDGRCVNSILLEEGYAKPYNGEKR